MAGCARQEVVNDAETINVTILVENFMVSINLLESLSLGEPFDFMRIVCNGGNQTKILYLTVTGGSFLREVGSCQIRVIDHAKSG